MPTMTSQMTASLLGRSFNVDMSVFTDNVTVVEPTVARAKVGTLTTRTDNDTGELTLEASHGVTTGATNNIDVYWDGGKRVGMTVGTVAGNVVPIDGGTGDNLPDADTDITAMVPQLENLVVTGDDVGLIAAKCAVRATLKIQSTGPAVEQTINLESDGSYIWSTETGTTNPIAGDAILTVLLSHEDGTTTAGRSVTLLVGFN